MLCEPEYALFCSTFIPTSTEEAIDLSAAQWEDINVVTGALKLFLRELPDPVIPNSLYQKFIDASSECPASLAR